MNLKKITGGALVASPFIGIAIYSVSQIGWGLTALVFAIAIGVTIIIGLGVALLNDYIGYHSDNEPELGENPVIATLVTGEVNRPFVFKHKETGEETKIQLGDNDLLIMKGETQNHFFHGIPKDKKITEPRYSLNYANRNKHLRELALMLNVM
ncbi:MAG: hypothetical protein CL840_16310 [Crocinitomicaceae bacterium]|nr:hypothetical protein [Crocinitomicaceae bacterium]|tara:strand:+ start:2300 stop:2758 length:459 start_codon:yes stop_codon:yes gene_type:complete